MADVDVAEILKLPAAERLRLVEVIWESLTARQADVPLSDAHREAIATELAEHRRDPNDVLSLDQILSGVRRPR